MYEISFEKNLKSLNSNSRKGHYVGLLLILADFPKVMGLGAKRLQKISEMIADKQSESL